MYLCVLLSYAIPLLEFEPKKCQTHGILQHIHKVSQEEWHTKKDLMKGKLTVHL